MRPTVAFISLLTCVAAACTTIAPSRLGYAPPTNQPAQPGTGYVGQLGADLIWEQLLDRLTQSGLQIDLADPRRGIMVASYNGDPAPYVTCGWILLYGGGEAERIDASSDASFNRMVGRRSFEIGRDLKLHARLVVEVRPDRGDAFVEANANYVLTKTVVAAYRSGQQRGRNYEIVSFSTGERAEFTKGTVCQPNGALERIVLDIVPPATQVARDTPPTNPPPTRRATVVETEVASNDLPSQAPASDNVRQQSAESGDLRQQAPASDNVRQQSAESGDLQQQAPASYDPREPSLASNDLGQLASAGDDSREPSLASMVLGQPASVGHDFPKQSSECAMSDKVLCEVLELIDPDRRASEERGSGLEGGRLDGGNPPLDGSGLVLAAAEPPQLGYAPPADQPPKPTAGYVGQPDLIWDQLLDRLNQSGLQVGLTDPDIGVIVATYSGDPTPYVTCGWILVYGEGEPEKIDASSEASFKLLVQGRTFEINRNLKLDARLVVEVRPDGSHASVEATSSYVLTKTVVAEDLSGGQRERTRETVSFGTGERGEFSKGTVCQPNGALERTVLDILPPAGVGAPPTQHAPPAATQRAEIGQTEIRSEDVPQPAESKDLPRHPSDCTIADKVFCEMLEITDPYRRANEERGLGLEMDEIEGGNPIVGSGGLGLDISLPSYDAYLAVSYFLRDGTVHHVRSGSDRRWPANAREFVGDADLSADQSEGVQMVVAVASDMPLFTSPRPPSEAAETYLADLRKRLAEMTNGNVPVQIAASLIVITPRQKKPS